MFDEQLTLGDDERAVTLKRVWERALAQLANRVSKPTYEGQIRPSRPIDLSDRVFTLAVPGNWAREWLEKRHSGLIRSTLGSILGFPVELRLVVTNDAAPAEPLDRFLLPIEAPCAPEPVQAPGRRTAEEYQPASGVPCVQLNDRYTFESYVVGRSNRLAHAVAVAVAESPGGTYNPVFIYGGSGLGKTHLLHAIGIALRTRQTDCVAAYVDGEHFTHQYVSALRERKMDDFRRYYRTADVWLVDDIQSIAGKEGTKEEFFHTFNVLHHSGKQIVITSDRSPRDLTAMDERLRSRFESGLIADIVPPAYETRVAIMEQRCLREGWAVPKDVIDHIAGAIHSNVRALEGAMTKLVAYSSIMRCAIGPEMAQSVLGEYFIDKPLPPSMRKSVSIDEIVEAVSRQLGPAPDAIRGQSRAHAVVAARQVAMYLARSLTSECLAQVGAQIGGRDHSTVQRAVARVEGLMAKDATLHATVMSLRAKLER